ALVGQQIADLLGDSETYVNRFVNFINHNFGTHIDATQVLDEIQRPDENSKMTLPYLYLNYPDSSPHTPGAKVPWLASQTDLLTDDWRII
ncbi:MAG: hypothetical protein RL715_818, partial [Chloroflexota bacterium]